MRLMVTCFFEIFSIHRMKTGDCELVPHENCYENVFTYASSLAPVRQWPLPGTQLNVESVPARCKTTVDGAVVVAMQARVVSTGRDCGHNGSHTQASTTAWAGHRRQPTI